MLNTPTYTHTAVADISIDAIKGLARAHMQTETAFRKRAMEKFWEKFTRSARVVHSKCCLIQLTRVILEAIR